MIERIGIAMVMIIAISAMIACAMIRQFWGSFMIAYMTWIIMSDKREEA